MEIALTIAFLALLLTMLLTKLYLKFTNGWSSYLDRMDGKTVVVTGANTGLGYECALELARRSARVILACRNEDRATRARDRIIAITGNKDIHYYLVDMLSLQSVRDFSAKILANERRIHVLVNNAGVGGLGTTPTIDGLHPTLQVNHYGPFLLTNLLLDRLKELAPSRIVTVSSFIHKYCWFNINDIDQCNWKFNIEYFTYSNSKLLNVFMSNELARKLRGTGVTSNCLHPGVVRTDFLRECPFFRILAFNTVGFFLKSAREGAQTQIFLSVDAQLQHTSGEYFEDCKLAEMSEQAKDPSFAKKVWEHSENMVRLEGHEKHY